MVGAASGDEGIVKARELRPHVITLDVMMPNKDGWQVLYDLKADPATHDIPVIMLTIVDRKPLGFQLGATDYLLKPFDTHAVLDALHRVTHLNGGQPLKRLLVADDDPNVIDMVGQLLGGNYEIDSAADGAAALEAIATAASRCHPARSHDAGTGRIRGDRALAGKSKPPLHSHRGIDRQEPFGR